MKLFKIITIDKKSNYNLTQEIKGCSKIGNNMLNKTTITSLQVFQPPSFSLSFSCTITGKTMTYLAGGEMPCGHTTFIRQQWRDRYIQGERNREITIYVTPRWGDNLLWVLVYGRRVSGIGCINSGKYLYKERWIGTWVDTFKTQKDKHHTKTEILRCFLPVADLPVSGPALVLSVASSSLFDADFPTGRPT